jgi:hypothetical protein
MPQGAIGSTVARRDLTKSTQNGGQASPLEGGCAWVACLASASERASHAAGGRGSGLRSDALIERLLGYRLGVGVEVTRLRIG